MRGWSDERGQAIQVGAIILFGFLVVAFAGYQAVSVPSQNQNVEFQHSMQVTDQMQEFRADTIEAASTGATRSQAFKLGTSYPARLFAVNPAPASGRLATTTFGGGEYVLDAPGANLEDICGLSREGDGTYDVPSKALVYEPDYNAYTQAPDVVYENTVAYRQFPGEVRLDSGQNLVDGKTITLTPLTGDVSESTSATRTVDLSPGKAGVGSTNTDSSESYILTIPTALDAGTWEELLTSELEENGGQVKTVTEDTTTGGVDIELASAEYTVLCPVVGLGEAPNNSPADEIQRSGDGGASLNPSGAGEVRLDSVSLGGGDAVDLTFENAGDEVNLTSVRYNFYSTGPGGTEPLSFDLEDASDNVLASDVRLRGPSVTPEETVTLSASDSRVLSVDFDGGIQNQDYFVIEMQFSDGQESLYFVDVENSASGNSAPSASFTYSPSDPSSGEQVDFDASGSSDTDGSVTDYTWEFGDGSTGSGVEPSNTYSTDGTYTVELTVEDDDGATDTVTQQVSVGNGGSGGDRPSVTVDTVSYSNNNGDLAVTFTPDDPQSNLDTADIVVTDDSGTEVGQSNGNDISGQEGSSVTITISNVGGSNAKPYTAKVTVSDTDDNTATASGSSG